MRELVLNNSLPMPALGFGTYRLKGSICGQAVADALAAGYRLLDTAASYLNEEEVGVEIAKSGLPRPELFVISKLWLNNYSADGVRRGVEGSLKRLGLDYLDLFLLHMPWGDWHCAWTGLEKCVKDGLCRAIGVSNFMPERVVELQGFHKIAPAADQLEINLLCQRRIWTGWLKSRNILPLAWAPLGRGAARILDNPTVLGVAKKHHASPAQIALAWILDQDMGAIVQTLKKERLEENLGALKIRLDDADMASLATLDTGLPQFLDVADLATIEKFCAAARPTKADLLAAIKKVRNAHGNE